MPFAVVMGKAVTNCQGPVYTPQALEVFLGARGRTCCCT